jgi:hypothetical protein
MSMKAQEASPEHLTISKNQAERDVILEEKNGEFSKRLQLFRNEHHNGNTHALAKSVFRQAKGDRSF